MSPTNQQSGTGELQARWGAGSSVDQPQVQMSDSFLAFLASAYPLSAEDLAQWQADQIESPSDLVDWLVDSGRIDPRIGYILFQFRTKAISSRDARNAIEAIEDELEKANAIIIEAAETTPNVVRQKLDPKVTEAITDCEEFGVSSGVHGPVPLTTPVAQFSTADPYSKTEVAVSTDIELGPTPPAIGATAPRRRTSDRRDSADFEHLFGQNFGKYLICTEIGKGAMGAILLAHHRLLGIPVAIKLLAPALAEDEGFRERFLSEGRFAANIQHPALARVFDCDERDGILHLVMEYVDGMSGRELLRSVGRLPEQHALRVARRIAEGLFAAQAKGIIHRDVKPGNILFAKNGHVKLTDMGLARAVALKKDTSPSLEGGNVVGTPLYMAPEQTGHEDSYDHRADIYALGGTLYHMLSGSPPFEDNTIGGLLRKHAQAPLIPVTRRGAQVSARTSSLVSWMLSKEPQERPAKYSELISEIDVCVGQCTNTPRNSAESTSSKSTRHQTTPMDPLGLGQRLSAMLGGRSSGS